MTTTTPSMRLTLTDNYGHKTLYCFSPEENYRGYKVIPISSKVEHHLDVYGNITRHEKAERKEK